MLSRSGFSSEEIFSYRINCSFFVVDFIGVGE